ncbi:MAG: S-methyl-5'-thioadenosine phosphorylase [Chloroflexi bacterium]|nr:S-methyl-5'-thioadenosine phosphorylase [Chloroflexota bacterium]
MAQARLGIIGGSGLYEMEGLTEVREVDINTPWGKPSDLIAVGKLGDVGVAFLPRHGKGHRILPTEVPQEANIYALKSLGVEFIVSVNAVGSLQEEIHPRDLVIPDQVIDRTKSRANTFFGRGIVAHLVFADPFCPVLSDILYRASVEAGATVHLGGTCVCMEGPLFSTRAESHLYRSWGASIIGMTALPEAKLAREAEICYASLACATDYDCWHQAHESVTIEMVIANLQANVATSKHVLRSVADSLPDHRACDCATALQDAIITDPKLIPPDVKQKLSLLIGKYVK